MSEALEAMTMDPGESFLRTEVSWHETPTAQVAHRTFGAGPPLVMLHGWPLWGFTFRKLEPQLSSTCALFRKPRKGKRSRI